MLAEEEGGAGAAGGDSTVTAGAQHRGKRGAHATAAPPAWMSWVERHRTIVSPNAWENRAVRRLQCLNL